MAYYNQTQWPEKVSHLEAKKITKMWNFTGFETGLKEVYAQNKALERLLGWI